MGSDVTEMLRSDNPLAGVDEKVHAWLTDAARLAGGYHTLGEDVVSIVARYLDETKTKSTPRICVSMCGSRSSLQATREHLEHAQRSLNSMLGLQLQVTWDLSVDVHGEGSSARQVRPAHGPAVSV